MLRLRTMMMLSMMLRCLLLLLLLISVKGGRDRTLLNLPNGDGIIQGYIVNNTRTFSSIPYAAPPVGQLRWQPPQPITPWSGVLDATRPSPHCMQTQFKFGYNYGDEDCLYLNVYAPIRESQELYPTLLYLHGGTFVTGGASLPKFNATRLAAKHQAVVVVTNYRLGLFGFFGSEELRARSFDNSTGNYGMQDQRLAMEWVKANILAFGGDPNRVMLFGESAGAASVSVHLSLPRSFGLFHSAIMESGGFAEWVAKPLPDATDVYNYIKSALGCDFDAASGGGVRCLEKKSAMELLLLSMSDDRLPHPAGYMFSVQWAPVIDGDEMLAHPAELLSQQRVVKDVPMIIGTNLHDGSLFDKCGENATVYHDWLVRAVGERVASEASAVYSVSRYGNNYTEMATRLGGDVMFTIPGQSAVRFISSLGSTRTSSINSPPSSSSSPSPSSPPSLRSGSSNHTRGVLLGNPPSPHPPDHHHRRTWDTVRSGGDGAIGPVYQYYFTHDPSCHTCDLPFVFDRLAEQPTLQPVSGEMQILAEVMGQYWTNFAATGDPNQRYCSAAAGGGTVSTRSSAPLLHQQQVHHMKKEGGGGDEEEGKAAKTSSSTTATTTAASLSSAALPHWPVFKYDEAGLVDNTMHFDTTGPTLLAGLRQSESEFWWKNWKEIVCDIDMPVGFPFTNKYPFNG